MKQDKLKFLMLLVLVLSALSSSSQTFKSKGIAYTILDDGTVGVTEGGNYSGKVVIPSQVNYYGTIFPVSCIRFHAFEDCKGLTSVVISDSVEDIEGSAFQGCTRLTSVTIGKSVEGIGGNAFEGCKRLRSIIIPNSVIGIGVGAFRDCTGLTSVTFGKSVKYIGDYAFEGCTGLTSITCKAETPPSFPPAMENSYELNNYGRAFYDVYKPTLYVPAESIEMYKNAIRWKDFVKIRAIK